MVQEVGFAMLKARGIDVVAADSPTSRSSLLSLMKVSRACPTNGSVSDLMRIVDLLAEKGASLRVLNAHIDTSNASGKAFLDMLAIFAEFETNLRRERQLEGIAKAKAAGVYRGRPALDRC